MILKVKSKIYISHYNSHGKRHRDNDLPACICSNGTEVWYKDGKRHRDNGLPSFIYSDGIKEWWANGKYIRAEGVNQS